jgi:hypothetical protein
MRLLLSRAILCAASTLLVVGCGGATVNTTVKVPPRIDLMTKPQQVLVVEQGFGGAVAAKMKERIASGKRHAIADESTVAAGNEPSVIVEGGVLKDRYDAERSAEEVQVERQCKKRSTKGKKGKQKCILWKNAYTYYVYSIAEHCENGVRVKVTSASDGAILEERDVVGRASSEQSERDEKPAALGAASLCATAMEKAMTIFSRSFNSYRKAVELRFQSVSSSSQVTSGIEVAKLGRLGRSKELFLEAIEAPDLSDEDRAWARYNLAVAHEALDEYAACLEQIDLASEVLGADDDLVAVRKACDG